MVREARSTPALPLPQTTSPDIAQTMPVAELMSRVKDPAPGVETEPGTGGRGTWRDAELFQQARARGGRGQAGSADLKQRLIRLAPAPLIRAWLIGCR